MFQLLLQGSGEPKWNKNGLPDRILHSDIVHDSR